LQQKGGFHVAGLLESQENDTRRKKQSIASNALDVPCPQNFEQCFVLSMNISMNFGLDLYLRN
jgi:hypothetical protein